MEIKAVALEGEHVRLEPLSMAFLPDLCEVGLDPEIWKWSPAIMRSPDDLRSYIKTALTEQDQGTGLPFAMVDRSSGAAIGSTRYGNVDREHHRLEIGWTWIGRHWQKTPVNTEVKYLMLKHAFETLGCIRVEFKTDSLNERSRAALTRIGAIEEGTLRNHMLTYTGRIRHSVYYSIVNAEWPQVKARLEEFLRRPFEPRT
jgi:RimJ/RimL family protein N-acetyltransferase